MNEPRNAPPPTARWSLEVLRVAGIPIRIHVSFLLLVAWVAFVHYQQDPELRGVGLSVLFLLVVFGTIVIHELCHALTARAFGVRTRDITLWPIGGVSNLERMPEHPVQELLVALAGPALNVALALALGAYLVSTAGWEALLRVGITAGPTPFLATLMWVNVILATFNLLPAFPMDGGRALRALLSLWLDRVQATRLAAAIGKGMAVLFGIVGLFANPLLVIIAVLVWLGAGAEASHAEVDAMLQGHYVADAMRLQPQVVGASEPLDDVAARLIAGSQRVFPVLGEAGEPVGVLPQDRLLRGLALGGPQSPVSACMHPGTLRVPAGGSLVEAFRQLRDSPARCLLVEDEHQELVGMLTSASLSAFVAVQAARRQSNAPGSGPSRQLASRPLAGQGA